MPAIPASDLAAIAGCGDPLQRGLRFVAALVRALAGRASFGPVVVGGFALELYSAGGYATRDIDLVMMHPREADEVLAASGFRRDGRYWLHEGLDLLVEFPGLALNNPGASARVRRVLVDGTEIQVIGIEDLLINRAFQGVAGSDDDWQWAVELAALHHQRLDWQAVEVLAAGEGIAGHLPRLRREAEERRR